MFRDELRQRINTILVDVAGVNRSVAREIAEIAISHGNDEYRNGYNDGQRARDGRVF